MTTHVVSMTSEEYAKLSAKLSPEIRFTSMEEFPLPHFWMYAPSGEVVVFTSVPIQARASAKLTGRFL
jgi:hypothetical protein